MIPEKYEDPFQTFQKQQSQYTRKQSQYTKKQSSPFSKPQKQESLNASTTLELSLEEADTGCEKQISFKRRKNNKVETIKLSIKVPAGMRSGKKLKLIGQSHQRNGKKGDLFVSLDVKKHPLFRCEQDNLIMDLPLSFSNAILGTSISVPTLTSKAKIAIRPGIHSGALLVLKNQGLLKEGGKKRGDLILEIHIDIPDQITEEDRKWFKEFRMREALTPAEAQFNIQTQKLFYERAS